MYRYNTLRVRFSGINTITAEIIMVDSKLVTLEATKILTFLKKLPRLKCPSIEGFARYYCLKVASYAFKTYPYTLTVKVKVENYNNVSHEMELSQEDLVIEQLTK